MSVPNVPKQTFYEGAFSAEVNKATGSKRQKVCVFCVCSCPAVLLRPAGGGGQGRPTPQTLPGATRQGLHGHLQDPAQRGRFWTTLTAVVAVVDGTVVVGMVTGLKSRVCSCGKRYLVRWALWSAVLLLAVVVVVVVVVVDVAVVVVVVLLGMAEMLVSPACGAMGVWQQLMNIIVEKRV